MNILIVTAFFPPFNSIASGRPYSWARYWSQAGHDVTVLTVLRPEESSDSPRAMDGIRVIRTPLLRPLWLRLLSPGGSVEGTPAASAKPGALQQSPSFLRRIWRSAKNRYGFLSAIRMPDEHDTWAKRSVGVVSETQWDVVVTTGGPYSVHYVGQALRRSGAASKWCVDWRDLWTRNSLFPGLPGVRWLERFIEQSFHRDADLVTTVSPPLADVLRQMCDKPVHVVYNGFDPADIAALPEDSIFPSDGVFRIVYTGTLYPTRQHADPFFAALAKLQREGIIDPKKFEVVIAGACGLLLDVAERYGVREFVTYRGMVPRVEALRLQRDAHALLQIGFLGAGQEGVLSGKIFEYLSAGPPVLGVTADAASSIGELLHESQRGVALGMDVDAIAAQIRSWIVQPYVKTRDAEMNQLVLSYTRERQAMRLLDLLV